jgi:hypothetical protein
MSSRMYMFRRCPETGVRQYVVGYDREGVVLTENREHAARLLPHQLEEAARADPNRYWKAESAFDTKEEVKASNEQREADLLSIAEAQKG